MTTKTRTVRCTANRYEIQAERGRVLASLTRCGVAWSVRTIERRGEDLAVDRGRLLGSYGSLPGAVKAAKGAAALYDRRR